MRMHPLLHRLPEQRDAQVSQLQELPRPVQRRTLSRANRIKNGSKDFEDEEKDQKKMIKAKKYFYFLLQKTTSFFSCSIFKEFEQA